jgi:hypothetical protein
MGPLVTPGVRTSEFKLAALNVLGQLVLAWKGTTTDATAVKYSLAGVVAYIVARGLAKTETRSSGNQ